MVSRQVRGTCKDIECEEGGNQSIFKCRPDSKAFGLTLADVVLVSVLMPLIGPLFLHEAETRGPGNALPVLRYLTVLGSYYILIYR